MDRAMRTAARGFTHFDLQLGARREAISAATFIGPGDVTGVVLSGTMSDSARLGGERELTHSG